MKHSCLIALALFSSSAFSFEAWKGFSDPEIMSSGFTHTMSELPLQGSIEDGKTGWSSTYWPSNQGGIANRWNSPNKESFKYSSPTREAVSHMSQEQLALLSPAEKFDLLLGDYSYETRGEAWGASSKSAKEWAGICHGWAPASTHHNEPTPKTLVNPDGIQIPFGSADIKGLLSFYYAFYTEEQESNQMGLRCFFGGWLGGARGCGDDLNAGAFHIVMTNKLGLEKKGFMVDIDRYKEVWNQPVAGYKTTILSSGAPSRGAAKSAVRELRVATDFFYVDESDPTWATVQGTANQKIAKMELEYTIELNSQGKIVGGDWISDKRPDFIWSKDKVTKFEGHFARLSELLND